MCLELIWRRRFSIYWVRISRHRGDLQKVFWFSKLKFSANLQVQLLDMESCSGSHFLDRALRARSHELRIPAKYVEPHIEMNKGNTIDPQAREFREECSGQGPNVKHAGGSVLIGVALRESDFAINDDGAVPVATTALQIRYLSSFLRVVHPQTA